MSRPPTYMLAARRLTSHSHGASDASSKSLRSNRTRRSGDAKSPKLETCASPHATTWTPVRGPSRRSWAMVAAVPR
ncbi:Uncharacterised protein [Mycobacteroides abscessus]|nr:Uncharacterised protein [Mycobacteroides abscessus]